jgi:hypothetical protein
VALSTEQEAILQDLRDDSYDKGQKANAATAGVALSTEQQAILKGLLDKQALVVDFMDTPVFEASVGNPIAASGVAPTAVVSALADDVNYLDVNDTTGKYIGVYNKAAPANLSDGLVALIGPGEDRRVECSGLVSGGGVWIRNMKNASITVGDLSIAFVK